MIADSSSELEFQAGTSKEDTPKRINFSYIAFAAFRTGISDRKIALRSLSMLQNPRIVTAEEKNLVIDKVIVRWHKKKIWKKIHEEKYPGRWKITIIFFDGRKEKMIFIERKIQASPMTREKRITYYYWCGYMYVSFSINLFLLFDIRNATDWSFAYFINLDPIELVKVLSSVFGHLINVSNLPN